MENIQRIILLDLMEDEQNFNAIGAVVENLVQRADIVNPERVNPIRNLDYYENVIPNYTLDDFYNHFRRSRETFQFQNLLNILQQRTQEAIGERVPLKKKFLFTIWMLSKPDSFISAGDRFNLAKSTSHQIFLSMVDMIVNLRHQYIIWPNERERQRISGVLQAKSGISGIIGAIDGCHIPIKAPPNNAIDYYNRNNYHSVILQAVCNDRTEFTDVFVGASGKLHDARVFRNSNLHTLLTSANPPIHENEHLLGDSAYPLSQFLLKPYRDNGHLSNREIRYNTRRSSVRSMIEQAFGSLKSKFRRLKYLDMARIDLVPSVIMAACILHNFIISHEGIERYEDENEVVFAPEENEDNINDDGNAAVNIGQRKRDYIASLLH